MKNEKNSIQDKTKNGARSGIKLLCLALAFLMTAFLIACSPKKSTDYKPDTVVASYGDETITYALYTAAFDSYVDYFKQMGYDPITSESDLHDFQDLVINALASDMLVLVHAAEDNFTLPEDVLEAVREEAQGDLDAIRTDYTALAQEAYAQDPSLTEEEHFEKLIGDMAEYYTGRVMTFAEYSEEYTRELINSKLIEEYKLYVCSTFNVNDAEIADWYAKQVESDEKVYAERPELFKQDMEYFERFNGINEDAIPVTYVPAGYSRIMDIVVRPSGSVGEQYNEMMQEMASVGEECSALLFDDALGGTSDNAERIAQLLERYRQLKTDTDALYEEYSAEARERINAAYAELEAGRPFQEVMLEYTENKIVTGDDNNPRCEAFATKGQLISLVYSSDADWSSTVKEIYGMTAKGAYSAVFTDEDGSLHIIYHGEDEPDGAVPVEAIHDQIVAAVREQKSETDWNELLDAWMDDPELNIDMDIVRFYGTEALETKSKS